MNRDKFMRIFSLAIFLICLFFISNQSASATRESFISTVWNKAAAEYKLGDVFSVRIKPRTSSFIYVFYVDHKNEAHALYPGKVANRFPVQPDRPLTVSKMTQGVLTIDRHQGKLITVAVEDSREGRRIRDFVLSEEDFMYMNPYSRRLDISGTQLMDRFQLLKDDHSGTFHYRVENAPRAN